MKPAILLAACLGLSLACTEATASALPASQAAVAATDFSARKQAKEKRKPVHPVPPRAPYPWGWRAFGADPSFDAYGRPYRPPSHIRCPIDLGYGRWTSCDVDF